MRLLRMVQDDSIDRHRPASKLQRRWAFQELNGFDSRFRGKVRQRGSPGLLLADPHDHYAGRRINDTQGYVLGIEQRIARPITALLQDELDVDYVVRYRMGLPAL